MDPQEALNRRAQVEDFQRRHHTKLVTMLFSDIVGSTKLKQILGDRGAIHVIQRHHTAFREILSRFDEGEEISTAGDAFFLVFAKPSDAVKFSLLVQAGLRRLAEGTGHPVFDRIGIHVGEVWVDETAAPGKSHDLYGVQVDTCARVSSLGGADQILLTRFAFDSARQVLKGEDLENLAPLSWLNHGPYLMKGVEEALDVCEVGETGKAALTRPADTERAHRFISPDAEPVLGWRPAVDQPVPGTSWVLEKKLGEGGFGEVWLGRDKILKTRHIFKFCFRADRVRSLKREVTLFRVLKERVGAHPNIVGIEATYFDEPPFYIVMQYVDGSDLPAWCETQGGMGKVPLAARLEIAAQAADALQAAHDSGVIHRDVKPTNILVGGDGNAGVRVHLTDFGIGQVVSAEALAGVTRAGFTMTIMESASQTGTHLYMAPELFAGKPASIRSDIYALGVVLYQLLAGDFTRPVTTDWAKQIADPLLREDLEKCFAGDPRERFAGAAQLATRLRTLPDRRAAEEQEKARIALLQRRAYRRGLLRAAAAGAVVIVLVAALAFYGLRQARIARASSERARRSAEAEASARAASDELLTKVQLQRAEDFLAADDAAGGLAYLANVLRRHPSDTMTAQRLLSALRDRSYALPVNKPIAEGFAIGGVAFSPDGRKLLVCAGTWAGLFDTRTEQPLLQFQNTLSGPNRGSFSPDGKRVLLLGFIDAGVFDAETGKAFGATLLHQGRLNPYYGGHYRPSAQFSPDGRSVLTTSTDKRAIIWSLASEDHPRIELKQGVEVYSAAWNSDGSRVASASYTGLVIIWNATSGAEISRFQAPPGLIPRMFFSPDNERLATISTDGHVRIWELKNSRVIKDLAVGAEMAAQSPDGRTLLVADSQHRILRCDAETGEILKSRKFSHALTNLGFSDKGALISTNDPSACVLDPQTLEPLFAPRNLDSEITAIDLSASGDRMVTATASGKATIWDISPRAALPLLLDHGAGNIGAALSPTAKLAVTTGDDGRARMWDTITGRPTGVVVQPAVDPSRTTLSAPAFSPDGSRFVTGGINAFAQQWDTAAGKQIGKPLRSGYIDQLEYSRDGNRLLVVASAAHATVWDSTTGVRLAEINPPSRAFMTPDGEKLLVLDFDVARPWSITPCKPLADALQFTSQLTAGAVSSDGTWFATGCEDGRAGVWSFNSGKLVAGPLSHRGAVTDLAFSPDRSLILTASADATARLWEAATGQPRGAVLNHDDRVNSAVFSADGRRVATGSSDGTARVWDSATGRPLSEPLRGHDFVGGVEFSRDGTQLLGVGGGTTAFIWNVEASNQAAPDWLPIWAEAIGGERLDPNGDLQPVAQIELTNLQSKLATAPGEDLYTRTARWFFMSAPSRSISPEAKPSPAE